MTIRYSASFLKSVSLLPKHVQTRVSRQIEAFKKDHRYPSLRVHKLKGRLSDFYAFRVDSDYRILFEKLDGNIVLLHKIGSHDLYRIN